jgi:ribonucleoside-diphosphate reductase subunit M2
MSVLPETPSKVAAAALSTIDLNSKPTTDIMAKLKAAAAEARAAGVKAADVAVAVANTPKPAQGEEVEEIEEYRTRFVGDLNGEEKDEPLLQETTARFVLFPIKYREVGHFCSDV